MKPQLLSLALACALSAGLGAAPALAAPDPAAASLMARLQRVEDTQKITDLIERYYWIIDARDYRAYSRMFTEDGELACCSNGLFKGRTAIFDMMSKASPDFGPGAVHTGSDLVIDLKGDTADVRSRWAMIMKRSDGQPGILERGHYEDVVVRGADGEWRFKSRRVVNEMKTTPPAAAPDR